MQAALVLSDGKVFRGKSFAYEVSADRPAIAEVVFNTSMFGYQEILTDPSYAMQHICFTTAQIGNVGCNSKDYESNKVFAAGLICKNYCSLFSNFRAEKSLAEFLIENKKPGISNLDTRALVQHLRDNGAQMGAIACGENLDIENILQKVQEEQGMLGRNLVPEVTCEQAYNWNDFAWDDRLMDYQSKVEDPSAPHILVLDLGVKHNILRLLKSQGFKVTVLPATSTLSEIQSYQADGLFLSNGPGDPATLGEVVENVKKLINEMPIFGICLGHQVLAQALGGKTFKLKFGHRGGNHPVHNLASKQVEITSQNHGFAVDAASMDTSLISHVNLNDQTVEGIDSADTKCFSVQYHPESSPGPHDSTYLFEKFYNLVRNQNA